MAPRVRGEWRPGLGVRREVTGGLDRGGGVCVPLGAGAPLLMAGWL